MSYDMGARSQKAQRIAPNGKKWGKSASFFNHSQGTAFAARGLLDNAVNLKYICLFSERPGQVDSLRLMKIRVVTFDIGGTLMAPYPSVGALYAEALSREGVHAPAETVQAAFQASWHEANQRPKGFAGAAEHVQWWRDLVADAVRRVGTLSPDAGDRVFEELWERFADPASWRLLPHAVEVLEDVRRRGYRTAVLSNWDQRLRPLLEKMGLMPLFDAVFISCELGWEKPDRRIFDYAQKHLNESPDAILHVGDSAAHDRAGALAAGWHCLLIHEHGDVRDLPHILEFLPEQPADEYKR